MEDQDKQEKNANEATPDEPQKETKIDVPESERLASDENEEASRNEAGPSTSEDLPGTVSSPNMHRTGRSKSEHNIPRLITRQDVANALKLTSISFGPNNPSVININIPADKDVDSNKVDSATMIDLKKFMASCFKFNKEIPANVLLPEVPVRLITNANEIPQLPNIASSSAEPDTLRENCAKTNEIIVTRAPVSEPKVSKLESDKKKSPENLSERSVLGLANRDSLSSIGSNVCRICMTKGRERLISPCNCKGSLANVHLSCLERWLNQVGRNHCELCGFSYPAIRTPRYTILQALRLWFGNPRNRSHLQSDCLIFWLLSTVTAGLLAVCIVGTQYFVIEGTKFGKTEYHRKDQGISHRITETALDFFMGVVLCGYCVTIYLLWKDHFVMWNRWRRSHVNVRLLLSPDTAPVPFRPLNNSYNIV